MSGTRPINVGPSVFDGRRTHARMPWMIATVVLVVTLLAPTLSLVAVARIAHATLTQRTEASTDVAGTAIADELRAEWVHRTQFVDAVAGEPVFAGGPAAAGAGARAVAAQRLVDLAVRAGGFCAMRVTSAGGAVFQSRTPGCPAPLSTPSGGAPSGGPVAGVAVVGHHAYLRTVQQVPTAGGRVTVDVVSPAPDIGPAAGSRVDRDETVLLVGAQIVGANDAALVGRVAHATALLALVAAGRAGDLDDYAPNLRESVIGYYQPAPGTPYGVSVAVSSAVALAAAGHVQRLLLAGWATLLLLAGGAAAVVLWLLRRSHSATTVAEEAYRQLADLSPDGVTVTGTDGLLRYVNPAAATIIGRSDARALVGETLPQADDTGDGGAPPWHDAVLHGASIFTSAEQLRHADGHAVWVEVNSAPIEVAGQRAVLSVFRDTTVQRATMDALAEAEAVTRTALETIAEGVILFEIEADGHLRPVLANPAAREILGMDLAELSAVAERRSVPAVVGADGSPLDLAGLPAAVTARTGDAVEGFVWGIVLPDGRHRWIRSTSRPVPGQDGCMSSVACSVVDVTEAHEREHERSLEIDRLTHRATHDVLTGLPNRTLLLDRIDQLAGIDAPATGYALLYVDIDRFKDTNDALGHGAGDELLRLVAAILRAAVRPGDTVARLGGDEFVLLAPGIARRADAEVLAERVRQALDCALPVLGTVRRLSASIGIAVASTTSTADGLLHEADVALYAAKQHGRNRWEHAAGDALVASPARPT